MLRFQSAPLAVPADFPPASERPGPPPRLQREDLATPPPGINWIGVAFKRASAESWRSLARWQLLLVGFTFMHVELIIPEPCQRGASAMRACSYCARRQREFAERKKKPAENALWLTLNEDDFAAARTRSMHLVAWTATLRDGVHYLIDRKFDNSYEFLHFKAHPEDIQRVKAYLADVEGVPYSLSSRLRCAWVSNRLTLGCCTLLCPGRYYRRRRGRTDAAGGKEDDNSDDEDDEEPAEAPPPVPQNQAHAQAPRPAARPPALSKHERRRRRRQRQGLYCVDLVSAGLRRISYFDGLSSFSPDFLYASIIAHLNREMTHPNRFIPVFDRAQASESARNRPAAAPKPSPTPPPRAPEPSRQSAPAPAPAASACVLYVSDKL